MPTVEDAGALRRTRELLEADRALQLRARLGRDVVQHCVPRVGWAAVQWAWRLRRGLAWERCVPVRRWVPGDVLQCELLCDRSEGVVRRPRRLRSGWCLRVLWVGRTGILERQRVLELLGAVRGTELQRNVPDECERGELQQPRELLSDAGVRLLRRRSAGALERSVVLRVRCGLLRRRLQVGMPRRALLDVFGARRVLKRSERQRPVHVRRGRCAWPLGGCGLLVVRRWVLWQPVHGEVRCVRARCV